MPIKIPNNLPATNVLEGENVFVMNAARAYGQDIRPLRILILNLMPIKDVTETQLLRLLGNFFNDTATTEIYTEYYTLSLHDARCIFERLPVAAERKQPLWDYAEQLLNRKK